MAAHPWVWRDGYNPYRRTLFQVLGLSIDVCGRAAIKANVKARRKRIAATPKRFPLFGDLLTEAAVMDAGTAIEDPEARAYAELCTHRARETAIDVSGLAGRARGLAFPDLRLPVVLDDDRLRRAIPPLPRRDFASLLD
jgi:hypothetical protein